MIVALLVGLVLHSKGYYIALLYLSAALAFFLLRTLRLRIEPEVNISRVTCCPLPNSRDLDYHRVTTPIARTVDQARILTLLQ